MRVLTTLVALIVSIIGAAASAAPEGPPVPPRAASLITPATPWRWQIVRAPKLAPQIGALAVSGLEVVAGRAAAPIEVLGTGQVPARWPFAIDEGVATIPAAPGPKNDRVAAAYGVTTFTLGAGEEDLALLELRLRFLDGVAVWINGVEVAREALPRTGATALAERPHGPEWQTFYIACSPGLLRHGANVLAIEVHPSGRRDAPLLVADLIGRRDRGILRGPVLAEVGATSARIVVETDPDTEATLQFGTGTTLDSSSWRTLASPAGRHHTFSLDGLPARAAVRYRVHAGASQSPEYTFHTQPAANDTIRIGVYGDVRGGHAVHKQLVAAMLDEPLDLVAVTGDMVLRGSDDGDWQRFFAITTPLIAQVVYLPAVGNHDLGWDGADGRPDASNVFVLPPGPAGRPPKAFWYSLDLADVHLVFLDSNAYELVEQDAWLEADLAAARARKVRAILAFTHDGPYARGSHRGNREAQKRFVPILARHHVELVMSGHDHIYQRGEAGGIRYIVSGGGGAPLYAPTCGVAGKPACKVDDGMLTFAKEFHYLVLTIGARSLEMCARRPDGRLVEKCVRYPLWRARGPS